MAIHISVVICCYNSAERLLPTLEHLSNQTAIQPDEWEIILVDNNSSDNTAQFAQTTWSSFGQTAGMRIVPETQPGQLYARLKGVSEARAELVAFVDDDNWLEPRWLRNAMDIMGQHQEVGALGGSIEAIYQTPPTDRIKSMERMLACDVAHESYEQILPAGGLIAGAGCVIRKSCYNKVLKKFGSFELTGRKGAALSGGDDIELLYKIQLLGYRVMRTGKLRLRHFIPSVRTTIPYLIKLARGGELGSIQLDPLRRLVCGQVHPSFWYFRLLAGFSAELLKSAPGAIVFGKNSLKSYIDFHARIRLIFQVLSSKFNYEQNVARLIKLLQS